jgi:hypothetical protein
MGNDRHIRKWSATFDGNEVFDVRGRAAGRDPLLRIHGLPNQRSQSLSRTWTSGQNDQQASIGLDSNLTLAPLSDAFQFVGIVCGNHYGRTS